jgi:quinol monooxygenase YgiN
MFDSPTPPTLLAKLTALPGKDNEVAALLEELAQEVRAEPGNVVFTVHRLRDDQNVFLVYEVYEDEHAFQAHMSTTHGLTFNERIETLVEGGASQLTWLTSNAT